jgi:hypothetical protein
LRIGTAAKFTWGDLAGRGAIMWVALSAPAGRGAIMWVALSAPGREQHAPLADCVAKRSWLTLLSVHESSRFAA